MDSSDSDSELLNIDEIFDRLLEEHESQLDPEIRRQGQEAAARAHEAWNEKRIRMQTERAIEGGFSSWEELLEHELEVDRQNTINYERRMMEKAAQLGITITELYAREYPESERRIPRRRPRCDCDVLMDLLEFRRRAEMGKLRIEQGKSKRLADDMLESYWDGDMEEISMKLPFWAEQDEVLQQIIRTKPVSDAIHSENFDQFTPNSTFTEDMESFKETATAPASGHPSPVPEPDARLSPLSCKRNPRT